MPSQVRLVEALARGCWRASAFDPVHQMCSSHTQQALCHLNAKEGADEAHVSLYNLGVYLPVALSNATHLNHKMTCELSTLAA